MKAIWLILPFLALSVACNPAQRRADKAYATTTQAYLITKEALRQADAHLKIAPPPDPHGMNPKDSLQESGCYLAELTMALESAKTPRLSLGAKRLLVEAEAKIDTASARILALSMEK